MSAINIIQRVARKLLTQNQPKGVITIPNRMTAEAKASEIAATLQRAGLSMDRFDDFITSETDLIRLLNQIEAFEKKNLADNIRSGIRNTESGKVFDMEGKQIPSGSQIMGGKAVDTDAAIKARLEAQNKDSVQRFKDKMDDPEDKADGGRIGLKGGLTPSDYLKVKDMLNHYHDYRKGGGKKLSKAAFAKAFFRENNADGGRIGYFMGSQFPKGLAALRQMLQYYGKKSDAVKNPSDILKIVNPKRFNKMLDDPNIYRKFDIEKGLAAPDMLKILQKQMTGERKKTIEEMLSSAKNIKKLDDDVLKNKNNMIEDMMKKGIDRDTAEEMAETISKMAESAGLGKFKDTPKLTDEGILELENILKNMETGGKPKRDLNADGGRIGLKDGMNRRTFLKLLGGLASIPIIGKIVKPLKTVKGVKNVPIIKTGDVPGKPEWFDQLVNKVIIEGDDVTKKLATKDREVIHTKKLNDTDEVTVYQDLETDSIRVEYNSPENVFGEPVDLMYTKNIPDEGAPKGSTDFEVIESGPVGRQTGPDDFDLDIDEVGGSSIKDLDSDVSKLKEYATGKGPTMKEFIQNKKRKDKAAAITNDIDGAASDAVIKRQGDYVPEYDDYASGGIAGMLGE